MCVSVCNVHRLVALECANSEWSLSILCFTKKKKVICERAINLPTFLWIIKCIYVVESWRRSTTFIYLSICCIFWNEFFFILFVSIDRQCSMFLTSAQSITMSASFWKWIQSPNCTYSCDNVKLLRSIDQTSYRVQLTRPWTINFNVPVLLLYAPYAVDGWWRYKRHKKWFAKNIYVFIFSAIIKSNYTYTFVCPISVCVCVLFVGILFINRICIHASHHAYTLTHRFRLKVGNNIK